MPYSATSSPIAIARRTSSTSSSPAWSPQDDLFLGAPVYSRVPSSSSIYSTSSSSSSSSSAMDTHTYSAWRSFGTRSRSNSGSSYISDEELAVDDSTCSSDDDDVIPAPRLFKRALKASNYRADADDIEVLQRVLAAGFTLADPTTESQSEVSVSRKEKTKSPRGSVRRSRSGNKTARRSNTMSTILEAAE